MYSRIIYKGARELWYLNSPALGESLDQSRQSVSVQAPDVRLDALEAGVAQCEARHPQVELRAHNHDDDAEHPEQARVRERGCGRGGRGGGREHRVPHHGREGLREFVEEGGRAGDRCGHRVLALMQVPAGECMHAG